MLTPTLLLTKLTRNEFQQGWLSYSYNNCDKHICRLNCFPFSFFQLGNFRHVKKVSFFQRAGGGRVLDGELCKKWCDRSVLKHTEVVVGSSYLGIICLWCKSALSTTPMLQSVCSLKLAFEVVLLLYK